MKISLTIAVMEKKETQINFLNSNLQRIPNNTHDAAKDISAFSVTIFYENSSENAVLGHRGGQFALLQYDQHEPNQRKWTITPAREGGFKIFTSTRSDGYHWKADISKQKVYLERNDDTSTVDHDQTSSAFFIRQLNDQISPLQDRNLYVCWPLQAGSAQSSDSLGLIQDKNSDNTFFRIVS